MNTETDALGRKLDAAVDANWDEQVQFLKELVRCESTLGNEAGAQRLMQQKLQSMGLEVDSWEPDPEELQHRRGYASVGLPFDDRPVVVGRWPGHGASGRSLVLNGHMDVVSAHPTYQWDSDPFEPRVEDGKLYGRGAWDMKGGLTAIVFALRALQDAGVKPGGDVIVQSVIEEECTGLGTLACLARGYRADGALLLEPVTAAVTADMGVLWCRVKVQGHAGHAHGAAVSANAIEKAFDIIQALKKLEQSLNSAPPPPYTDVDKPINFNFGTIQSGDWPSNVPGECVFEVRIGFYPGTSPDEAEAMVKRCMMEAAAEDEWLRQVPPEVTFFGMRAEGVVLDPDNDVIQALGRAHRQVTGEQMPTRVTTSTADLRFFAVEGIPVTRYGPAGGNMHGPNEYIELDSLKETTRVTARFILDWAG